MRDDIVRSLWRHKELSGNDLAARDDNICESRVVTKMNGPKVELLP